TGIGGSSLANRFSSPRLQTEGESRTVGFKGGGCGNVERGEDESSKTARIFGDGRSFFSPKARIACGRESVGQTFLSAHGFGFTSSPPRFFRATQCRRGYRPRSRPPSRGPPRTRAGIPSPRFSPDA